MVYNTMLNYKIIHRIFIMKILNYDIEDDEQSKFKQLYDFMPNKCYRLLLTGPSGSGKTNFLLDMIYRLLYFDKIYLYTKNPQQSKIEHLLKTFAPINEEVGYDIIVISNDGIIPLDEISDQGHKIAIFDDYLNTGSKNDSEIRNYFTNSRNKNCSCIYISQSFYNTDKTIRLNSTHHCIFEFPSNNEQSMICRELGINKKDYLKATADPFSFLYIDKPRKFVTKNFNEKI